MIYKNIKPKKVSVIIVDFDSKFYADVFERTINESILTKPSLIYGELNVSQ